MSSANPRWPARSPSRNPQSAAAADATADHDHDAAAGGRPATEEHSHGDDDALVSRANQATWGLATATVVFGVALGGIIGLVSAFAVGRLGRLTPRASTALVAAIGFVAVYFVPYLKYPPNPPAVGNPDTIGDRTALYFTMLAVSVVAAVAAVVLARRLARTMDAWNAGARSPSAGIVLVVGVTAWLLPVIDEVPADFSADLLWRFRMASLTVQATLWLVIGLVLASHDRRGRAAVAAKVTQPAHRHRGVTRSGRPTRGSRRRGRVPAASPSGSAGCDRSGHLRRRPVSRPRAVRGLGQADRRTRSVGGPGRLAGRLPGPVPAATGGQRPRGGLRR